MFLIDTNCWIQIVRDRPLADEMRELLRTIPTDRLHVTIFSVHGIGVIMARHGALADDAAFLDAMSIGENVRIIQIPVQSLGRVAEGVWPSFLATLVVRASSLHQSPHGRSPFRVGCQKGRPHPAEAAIAHRLDFDDAYQYVAAELNGLTLVSLDADFDRTPSGRLTPAAALQRFRDEQRQGQQDA